MNSSASGLMLVARHRRLLITKIIIGVGLAVLLLIGSVAGGHREGESSGYSVPPATTSVDVQSPLVAELADAVLSSSSTADSVWLSVAGCLLGVVCCFLFLIVTRSLSSQRTLRLVVHRQRVTIHAPSTGRTLALPLSLTQLSLSRT